MKRTIPLVLMILILVLTVAGPIAGCSPAAEVSGNPDNLQKARVLEIMRATSIWTWCIIIEDTQTVLSLLDRFGNENSSEEAGLLEGVCHYLAIDLQDVTFSAQIYPFGPIYLLSQFKFDDMRANLAEYGFHRSDREGIETWWEDVNEDSEWSSTWVMLHGNLTIFGSDGGPGNEYSKYCIRALTGEDKSLDEDPYFRNIIDDFPSAVLYDFSRVNQQDCEELKLYAVLMLVNGEILTNMVVFEFTDSAAAMRYREGHGDDMRETAEVFSERLGPDVKTEWYQSDQYIVIVAEAGLDQYRSLMAP
jgi:hypothetical protein